MPALNGLAEGKSPVRIFDSLDEAVTGANAVMMLRIQKERISTTPIPDADEYHEKWGLKAMHLDLAEPGCRVLHPGPMNLGVEISPEVTNSSQYFMLLII